MPTDNIGGGGIGGPAHRKGKESASCLPPTHRLFIALLRRSGRRSGEESSVEKVANQIRDS